MTEVLGGSGPVVKVVACRRLGPFRLEVSQSGYGWNLKVGRRLRWNSRKATTPMLPCLRRGADENCNRAISLVAWPLGSLDFWWEIPWRTDPDGLCVQCREEATSA